VAAVSGSEASQIEHVRILSRVALENTLYYLTISCYFACQHPTSLMSKTSQSTREILISVVQTNPSLWDDTHPEYINREKNKKKWEEVGKITGLTGIKRTLHRQTKPSNDQENALLGVFVIRKHATFKPRPLHIVGCRPTIVLIRERCLLYSQPSSITDRVNNAHTSYIMRTLLP